MPQLFPQQMGKTPQVPPLAERKALSPQARSRLLQSLIEQGCASCGGNCCWISTVPLFDERRPLLGLLADRGVRERAIGHLASKTRIENPGDGKERVRGFLRETVLNPLSKEQASRGCLSDFFECLRVRLKTGSTGACLFKSADGCVLGEFKPEICWNHFCGDEHLNLKSVLMRFTPFELLLARMRKTPFGTLIRQLRLEARLLDFLGEQKLLICEKPTLLMREIERIENGNGPGFTTSLLSVPEAARFILGWDFESRWLVAPLQTINYFAESHDSKELGGEERGRLTSGSIIRVI